MPPKNRKNPKWEMAMPFYKHDNLIASPQFKNLSPFNVSYEVDKHINMNYIMGWEYGRIWFKEYKRWEKMNYGSGEKGDSTNTTEICRRKYVVRAVNKKSTKKIKL